MGKEATQKHGGFTSENAKEMQLRSAEKKKQNKAERMVMREVALKRVKMKDRAAICDALIEKAKKGDEKATTLLLQIIGELPDAKQSLDVNMNIISDADRKLLDNAAKRYENARDPS